MERSSMNASGTDILLQVPPVDNSRTATTEPVQTAREAHNETLFMKFPLYSIPFDEGISDDAFGFIAQAADSARENALNTASSE